MGRREGKIMDTVDKKLIELLEDVDNMQYSKDWQKLDYLYGQIKLLVEDNND
jgi:hypothetical protein